MFVTIGYIWQDTERHEPRKRLTVMNENRQNPSIQSPIDLGEETAIQPQIIQCTT